MNILANYDWLKEYVKTGLSAEEFAKELSLKSMSVESVASLRDRYAHMVVGMVKSLEAHPDADRLQIAHTDIGGSDVAIVCGGKNLREGMRVLVALPGAKVRWHGEGDLVELEETAIRGVKSHGMICAPEEVDFGKYPVEEGGIWPLDEVTDAKPGTPFVEALDMDDTLFDIEITTNRPDAMSIVGLAREGAVATDGEFTYNPPALPEGEKGKAIDVRVDDPELCPRYMAVVMDGVRVGPSPVWLQKKLLLAGHRPINNIVDITNYVLHEYGQPLHAFDYDALEGGELIIRRAKDGEKIEALDDEEYELSVRDLVIADKQRPVAVAGVMGGTLTGTWEETRTIVFEAATFDPVSVRKTARSLNLYSDSQQLFEKGLSSEAPAVALARAIELVQDIAGGDVASEIVDERAKPYRPLVFPLQTERIRKLLDVDVSDEEQIHILERLGFSVEETDGAYQVTVPYWRDHDIEHEIDFAEEVARMYGYHRLPATLPQGRPPAKGDDTEFYWEDWLKATLAASGYTECYGYSFVHADQLARYGLDPDEAMAIYNPLSSALTHMRTSLMPSILADIERNQGHTACGRVFELAHVYLPRKGDLPEERTELVVAEYGMKRADKAFFRLKGIVEYIAGETGLSLSFEREDNDTRWHATRSAQILHDGKRVGTCGQVASTVQSAYGIDRNAVALQLDVAALIPHMRRVRSYEPISEFPSVERDVAIIVDQKTPFTDIQKAVHEQDENIASVSLADVYRGSGIPEGQKSITLNVTLRASDRTLSSEEVNTVMESVEYVLKEQFDAILR